MDRHGDELRDAVGQIFGEASIARCEPHPLRSSCSLWELDLVRSDGSCIGVVLKDLGRQALDAEARRVKPDFLFGGAREIDAYRGALAAWNLGTPEFHGAHVDPARDRYWLFLEFVDGRPLWQSGSQRAWAAAAEWLAGLHSCGAASGFDSAITYDTDFYAQWMERAQRFAPSAGLERIEDTHDRAIERLASAPRTFIHGEFYPSNVLVRPCADRTTCPVDFELAGLGPGVVDLAALTTGLPDEMSAALVTAYVDGLAATPAPTVLDELLLCARLHLAVRWLGWAPDWQPPAHHAMDWAAEAQTVADRLAERL